MPLWDLCDLSVPWRPYSPGKQLLRTCGHRDFAEPQTFVLIGEAFMKIATALSLLMFISASLAWQTSVASAPDETVTYPEGYRNWVHVKTVLVSPAHKQF